MKIKSCTRCDLFLQSKRIVSGEGAKQSIMMIGEAPGQAEDNQGRPFVGKAGKHLNVYLDILNLDREKDLYITNVLKCKPPWNRDPTFEEIDKCKVYLEEEFRRVKPKLIVLLGRFAIYTVLGLNTVAEARGRWHDNILCTYHPSWALRNLNGRCKGNLINKELFRDLLMVVNRYDDEVDLTHKTKL